MAKVNVNEATREELVEAAGLRPELADAILKHRSKHGGRITEVNALEELPGIGPATLDQLRKALDFADKRSNGSEPAKSGEKEVARQGERATEAASSAARGGIEATRQAATEAGAQSASSMAREGLKVVQRASDAAGEVQRETARQSAEGAAELSKLWMELLNEQTRANLEFATTFGRVVDWQEVIRVQSEYARASFERFNELNRRYLEIARSMMTAAASTAEETREARARKAG
jgi:competence protein ComEA